MFPSVFFFFFLFFYVRARFNFRTLARVRISPIRYEYVEGRVYLTDGENGITWGKEK